MGRGRKARKQKGEIKTEKKKTTMDAATAYVNTVEEAFRGEGQISRYHDFLQLLCDLRHDTDTNTETMPYHHLTARLNDLFRLHPHLITGFNVFLPQEYHFDPDVATTSGRTDDDHPEHFR